MDAGQRPRSSFSLLASPQLSKRIQAKSIKRNNRTISSKIISQHSQSRKRSSCSHIRSLLHAQRNYYPMWIIGSLCNCQKPIILTHFSSLYSTTIGSQAACVPRLFHQFLYTILLFCPCFFHVGAAGD